MPFFILGKEGILSAMQRVFLFLMSLILSAAPLASDFGTTGLIDIPTARMSSDGTLTTTAAIQSRTNSYAITYQATPWLEGTFRYTGFNRAIYSMIVITRQKSGFGKSKAHLPQVAVGIRDLWGRDFGALSMSLHQKRSIILT